MKRVCLVPARGGSKRLPGKNIADLCGKPLIYHTLDVVSSLFDSIVVTTDSAEVFKIVKKHASKKIVSIARPAELVTDTSKVLETVIWYYETVYEPNFDQIWLCLPTCPFRSKEDVVGAQNLLTNDIDGVVSITDFDFPPTLGLIKNDDGLIFDHNPIKPFITGNTRSQDHGIVYRPNGALYGSWWESFGKNKNFFKGKVKGYYMPRKRSVDIDTELDLEMAEVLLKLR